MITLSKDSPLRSVWLTLHNDNNRGGDRDRCNRCNNGEAETIQTVTVTVLVFVSALGGILASGYLCFAIGAVLAFEATRAVVRVVGGYRSEWLRFLRHEVHSGYLRCRSAASVPTTATSQLRTQTQTQIQTHDQTTTKVARSLRHPLTGRINGYHVEYAYTFPRNSNSNKMSDGRSGKRMAEVRRIILSDKHKHKHKHNINNKTLDTETSISCYRKEVVRSLVEYIQHKNYETEHRRRMESDKEDSDDSSSDDSSNSSSSSSDSEERRGRQSGHGRIHRKPPSRNHPEPFDDDSFLVPISRNRRPQDNSAILETDKDTGVSGGAGLPYGYWMEKRRDLLVWSELIEPVIAFFGMNFYLLGCFLHAFLTCPVARPNAYVSVRTHAQNDFRGNGDGDDDDDDEQLCARHICNAMLWAAFAVALMIPYCVLEARAVQRKRIACWKGNGDLLECGTVTEIDRAKNALRWCLCFGADGFEDGTKRTEYEPRDSSCKYYLRVETLYAPSFAGGMMLLWLAFSPMTLFFGCLAVYCMVQWIDETSPIRKVALERFRDNPGVVSGVPATASLVAGKGRNERYVQLRYEVEVSSHKGNSNGNDKAAKVVTKDIQSTKIYKLCEESNSNANSNQSSAATVALSIHLHPSYPLSGYPTVQLEHDISNSWGLLRWQGLCFATIWCYLVSACSDTNILLYYPEDANPFDEELNGLYWSGILVIGGLVLLLPGASVLRQLQYHRFLLDELYEPEPRRILTRPD